MTTATDVLATLHDAFEITEIAISHQLQEKVLDASAEGVWQITYTHPDQGDLVRVCSFAGRYLQVQVYDEACCPNANTWRFFATEPSSEQVVDAVAGALAAALYFRGRAAAQPSRHGRRRWRMVQQADRRERARTAYIPMD